MTDFEDDSLLTEVFNLGSAAGYPFTISAPGEYPADPAITFQSVFKDEHGNEFAFRVYKANLIQGSGQRKYGKNTRVLAFMRRKTKNFAQNITLDSGTFKKALVTFMQSYEAYKETKDGLLASSYAIILQASLKNYASLFVRATVRAFKSNKKTHLKLYGVNEDGVGGSIELLYVNPQSIYPYFGGPEFDEAKFVGNPTHVKLAKLEGVTVTPVNPLTAAATSTTGAKSDASINPTAAAQAGTTAPVAASAAALPDPMNNPAAFNDELFQKLHFAQGRDALEEVLKTARVHRKYLQANFSKLFNDLYAGGDVAQLFSNMDLAKWQDGLGFYLKRYDSVAYAYIVVLVTYRKSDGERIVADMSNIPNEINELRGSHASVLGSIRELFSKINALAYNEMLKDISNVNASTNFNISRSDILNQCAVLESVNLSQGPKSLANYFTGNDKSFSDSDFVKIATVMLSFGTSFMSPYDYKTCIASHTKVIVATLPNGNWGIRDYSTMFDHSQEIIDALNKAFPALKDSFLFGSVPDVSDALLSLFASSDFRQMGRAMQQSKGQYDKDVLNAKIVEFIMNASIDYVDGAVEYLYEDAIGLEFPDAIGAMFARIKSLPADKSLTSSISWLAQNSTKNSDARIRPIALEYFKLRPLEYYTFWVDNAVGYGIYGVDVGFVDAIPITFDIAAFIAMILVKFNPTTNAWYQFSISPLWKKLLSVITESQLLQLYDTDVIDLKGLIASAEFSPHAATIALLKFTPSQIVDFLKTYTSHSELVQQVYANANTATQAVMRSLILALDPMAAPVQSIINVIGSDAYSADVKANPSKYSGRLRSIASHWLAILNPDAINAMIVYAGDPSAMTNNEAGPTYVDGINRAGAWKSLSKDAYASLFTVVNSYDRSQKPSTRSEFEEALARVITEGWSVDQGMAEAWYNNASIEEQKITAKIVMDTKFMQVTKEALAGDSVPIKPLVDLDANRIKAILKYNDLKVPRAPIIKPGSTLADVMAKSVVATDITKLAVAEETKTDEELQQMSVEYDAFNRYRHGNIAVKIVRSFNVTIPVQETGFAAWIAKMQAENTDPQIMRPVFHGTGSVAASMILRYGFKVITAGDASVVGRMLGDGIYFSNVIDKVSQYMSDGGYSRGVGIKGYIFEMEASLGKYRRDFNAAGPGTGYDTGRVISPEWAVFNANDQLRIYKAYECVLISKEDMDVLKSKQGVNEDTEVVGIKHFDKFVNEAVLRNSGMKNAAVFIFMDGTIPVSSSKAVDFEQFDASKFGRHVTLDQSGSGPTVQIATDGPGGVFCVRYTNAMMHNNTQINQFLDLLNGK